VDEIDSEQLQVILPGHAANKPAVNVGEAYGRSFEQPLVATASPMSLQFPAAARPVTAARPVAAPVPARVAGASRVAMPAPDRRRDDTRGLLAVGAGLAVLTGLALLKPLLLGLKP